MIYRGLFTGVISYPTAPLRRCIDDAYNMATMVERDFGFNRRNKAVVRMLTDHRCTRANLWERLNWLVSGKEPICGVLFQSGHGAQIASYSNDEPDKLDEVFCPIDFDWNNSHTMISDDNYEHIFRSAPGGSRFIFISDSCHSGDLVRDITAPETPRSKRAKTISPPVDIAWRNQQARNGGTSLATIQKSCPDNVVAISACRPDQVAVETPQGGAFTLAFMRSLLADPLASLLEVVNDTNVLLANSGYAQESQIVGKEADLPFFICNGESI